MTADAVTLPEQRGPAPAGTRPRGVVGSGVFVRPSAGGAGTAGSDGKGDITFNFVNADVRDVMRELLGEQLHLEYAVDPRVQAVVTAQTGGPIPRSAVIPTLESILRASGVALLQAGNVYRAVPLEDATKESTATLAQPNGNGAGYSVRVLPLKFIRPGELKPILDPFVPPGGTLQADDTRHTLIVSGPSADLEGFADLVRQFDVDWLSGKSFAVYPLHVGKAKDVVSELEAILEQGKEGTGPLASLVRVVPIERRNAVLVISSQPAYLRQVKAWVDQLDYGDDAGTPRFFKYSVQNTRAADLARVLRQLFPSSNVKIVRPETAPKPNFTQFSSQGTPNSTAAGATTTTTTTTGTTSTATPIPTGQQRPPEESEETAAGGAPGTQAEGLELPPARIVADEKNNSLVVYARPHDYRTIEDMLHQLDVAPRQVMIEATVAELTLNDALQYGLQYFLKDAASRAEFTTSTSGTLTPADIAGVFPGFNYIVASTSQHAVLNLLKSVSTVTVLSSPELLVRDNQTAGLQVGAQVPIVTQSAEAVVSAGAPIVNSIDYRNTGVILQVTPRINPNGMIALDIDQEVSDVATTTSSTINSPTINERHLVSSIIARSGETIALGGLIQDNSNDTKQGLPVLSDIPVVGPLFRSTSRSLGRTELIVLLSPRVMRNSSDEREMTEDLRNRLRELKHLLPPSR